MKRGDGVRAPELATALALTAVLAGIVVARGGFGASINGTDLYGAMLPKYRAAAEALLDLRLPLWNPFEYCGLPLLGTAQGAVLYPPVVLANLLPLHPLLILQVLHAMHLFALVLFTLRYLQREAFALPDAAVGALLVATGAFTREEIALDHPSFLFGLTWVPLMLLGCRRLASSDWSGGVLLALGAALQWLAGHPDIPMNMCVLVPLVVLADPGRGRLSRLLAAALALGAGVLLAAPQILALAETVGESMRGDRFVSHIPLFQSIDLPGVLLTRLGPAGVICFLAGLARQGWKRRAWTIAFLWALFALNRPLALLYEIYPFSKARSAYGWSYLWPVFAAYLAAAGFRHVRTRSDGSHVPSLLVLAAATVFAARGWASGAALALVCTGALMPQAARRGWIIVACIAPLHIAAILWQLPTSGRWKAPDLDAIASRVAVLQQARSALPGAPRFVSDPEISTGMPLTWKLPSAAGIEPALPPRRVIDLLLAVGMNEGSYRFDDPRWKKLAGAHNVSALLGIGLVVAPTSAKELLVAGGFKQVRRLAQDHVLLHRPILPRAHLVHEVAWATSEEESLRLVTSAAFDPAQTVVVESPDLPRVEPTDPGASESVRIVRDEPERVTLQARVASAAVLVLTDTFFPGWIARIDGVETAILPANHAFRAIALAPGTHVIEFTYAPRSSRTGFLLATVGAVLTAAFAAAARRHPPARPPDPL
jgi:hypothetical protein